MFIVYTLFPFCEVVETTRRGQFAVGQSAPKKLGLARAHDMIIGLIGSHAALNYI